MAERSGTARASSWCRAVALVAVSVAAVGCASTGSRVIQSGYARSPRPENCELTFADLGDLLPGGKLAADYEMIGVVQVAAAVGAAPTDPAVKAEVKPKACQLGGEVIVLQSSLEMNNGATFAASNQALAFMVYARKASRTGPQAY